MVRGDGGGAAAAFHLRAGRLWMDGGGHQRESGAWVWDVSGSDLRDSNGSKARPDFPRVCMFQPNATPHTPRNYSTRDQEDGREHRGGQGEETARRRPSRPTTILVLQVPRGRDGPRPRTPQPRQPTNVPQRSPRRGAQHAPTLRMRDCALRARATKTERARERERERRRERRRQRNRERRRQRNRERLRERRI